MADSSPTRYGTLVPAESFKALADTFRQKAKDRADVTPSDPVVETFRYCARMLDETRITTTAQLARLSPEEFGALADVQASASTVRRWCDRGWLAGAVKTSAGDWAIPQDARPPETRLRQAG